MERNGIILLIEDDVDLSAANRRALELRRYTVYAALTLDEAKVWLTEVEPDIILLDVMLPDGDGFSFCEEIRGKTQAHILFLTAKAEHVDMVKGLSAGGDDYITKPFHAEELLARVEAVMRRRRIGVPTERITRGPLTLDLFSHRALLHGEDLRLAKKEFDILFLLLQNEGKHLNGPEIYEKVWGRPITEDNQAVQSAISRCRRKIEPAGYSISISRGKGYMFEKR